MVWVTGMGTGGGCDRGEGAEEPCGDREAAGGARETGTS